jgi:hypothetical protein
MASLCRQQAAYQPSQSWQLLGQAERFEYLAQIELEGREARNITAAADPRKEPVQAVPTTAA